MEKVIRKGFAAMIRRFTPEDRSIFLEMSDEFYHTHAVDHVIPRENMTATFDTILKGSPYADGGVLRADPASGGTGSPNLKKFPFFRNSCLLF